MKIRGTYTWVVVFTVSLAGQATAPTPSGATSLAARDASPRKDSVAAPRAAAPTKDEIVAKYVASCLAQPMKQEECGKVRIPAVEILKEDLQTLGSSTNRTYMPTIVKIFRNDEVELRIAAADALGMIGPQDQDVDALAPLANDPVPDVRRAVSQAISHGKGSAISLLGQRTPSMKTGLAPETPADAAKYSIPVAPDSTYLFYGSDAASGRLSYTSKNEAAGFFKAKAKTGPFKLDEFQEKYRYQLQDEEQALKQAQDTQAKQMQSVKPPDPTDSLAFMQYMEQIQSVSMRNITRMALDSYQPTLFGSPTVYILEERQIGQRSYPTRYVVLYQDLALKRPGYRLNWMTAPEDLVKTAQVASIVEEKEEMARKKESEALKKRAAELDALTKKKDEAEKKQFKKGQEDLEKALGF
jgi:hypothetical protein